MRFCCILAVGLLTTLTPCAQAGSSWFDDFDTGVSSWTGADGKANGIPDMTMEHDLTVAFMSMRVEQVPVETRPEHHFTFSPDVLSACFYDDAATNKTFWMEVRGLEPETLTSTSLFVGMNAGSSTYLLKDNDGTVTDTLIVRREGWRRFQIATHSADEILVAIDSTRFSRGVLPDMNLTSVVFRSDSANPADENRVWVDEVGYQNGLASLGSFPTDRWFIAPSELTSLFFLSNYADTSGMRIDVVSNSDPNGGVIYGGRQDQPLPFSAIDPAANTAQAPDGNPVTVDRISNPVAWRYHTEGLTDFALDVHVPVSALSGVDNQNRLVIMTRPNSLSAWKAHDTEYDPGTNMLIARNLDSLYDLTVGGNSADSNMLPVTLSGLSLE